MSSRPSNSRRRATTETAVEGTSRNSISQPSTSKSTEVFRRPPLTPMTPDANQGASHVPTKGVSHLPPHPYQPYTPASYHYHTSATAVPVVSNTHLQPEPYMSTVSPSASSVNVDPANPKHMMVQQTYYVHHHYYNHHLVPPQILPPNPPQSPPPPSERRVQISQTLFQLTTGSRLVRKYRRVILVLLFLPLPPLLSVLYVVVGHSLLRRASSSSPTNTDSHNPWSPSLISSANAAAAGGIILSLPLFLTLYIILPSSCHAQTRSRTPRDDFFEDDDEARGGALARVLDIAVCLACVIILICVGGAAAALGVTCLAGGSVGRGKEDMLTAGRAAEAGIVGGAVLLAAVLVGAVVGLVVWWLWMRRRRMAGVEEEKN